MEPAREQGCQAECVCSSLAVTLSGDMVFKMLQAGNPDSPEGQNKQRVQGQEKKHLCGGRAQTRKGLLSTGERRESRQLLCLAVGRNEVGA